MVISYKVVVLAILVAREPRLAAEVVLDVATVLNSFRQELEAGHHDEFVLLGNIHWDAETLIETKEYTAGFQLAVYDGIENALDNFGKASDMTRWSMTSAIIFIVPSSLAMFMDFIRRIPEEMRKYAIPMMKTRRVIFLSWPEETDDASVVEGLLMNAGENITNILKRIRQFQEIYVPIWNKKNGILHVVDLVEVYASRGVIPIVEQLERPQMTSGQLDMEALLQIATRRNNLRGAVMSVIGQPDDAFKAELTVEVEANGTVKFTDGVVLLMLQDFMLAMNFTYKPIKGDGWIGFTPNFTSLTGLGAQIMRKEADICISLSEFEEYRVKFIRYLQPLKSYPAHIIFRQPTLRSTKNIYILPFTANLWFAISSIWILVMVSGYFFFYQRKSKLDHSGTALMYRRYRRVSYQPNWAEFCLWAVGVLCQNGWWINASKFPLRVLCTSALFFSLVTYAFYSSFFVASTSIPTKPIQSLADLIELGYDIKMDPEQPTMLNGFLLPDNVRRKIEKNSESGFGNLSSAVRTVLTKSGSALITGLVDFHAAGGSSSPQELCEVDTFLADTTARMKEAMVVRKTGSFREFFTYQSVVLIERGLADLYRHRYEYKAGVRCLQERIPVYDLEMLEVYMAFVLLASSFLIALIVGAVELKIRKIRDDFEKDQLSWQFRFKTVDTTLARFSLKMQ